MSDSDDQLLLPPPSSKPVRDLFQLKDDGEPITLTINGKITLPVRDEASFDKLVDLVEWLDEVEEVRLAVEEIEQGKGISLEDAKARLRERHGVPH